MPTDSLLAFPRRFNIMLESWTTSALSPEGLSASSPRRERSKTGGLSVLSGKKDPDVNLVQVNKSRASGGLNLSSYSTGFYGVIGYGLSFGQTCAIAWTVAALGSMASAYMAIYGKKNGLRALASSRFAFGFNGAMVMALFNAFTEVSYGIIDCILGGQALQTISDGRLPLPVGIIIIRYAKF
jgi:hypothetical protein